MLLSSLHTKITGDSSGLVDAYGRALVADKRLATQQQKSTGVTNKSKLAYEQTSSALDKVRRSLDPLYAAQKRNAQLQKIVDAQLEAGNITKEEAIRYNQRLAATLDLSGSSAESYNQAIRSSRFATGNLAAQFNDIGVMLASGQSPLILAVQQGTQVSQVLNMMGSRKEMISGLATAFRSFVSPVSLATIALIAGGAALVQWGMNALGAEEETTKLAKAIAEAQEKSVQLGESIRQMQLGVTAEELALMDNYKQLFQEVVKAQELLDAASGRSKKGSRDRLIAAQEALRLAEEELEVLRERQGQEERLKSLAEDQAALLQEELDLIEAQEDARRAIQRAMIAARLTASGLVNESGEYVKKMAESFQNTKKMKDELGAAKYEALRLAGVDMSTYITLSASEAARLQANLGGALRNALAIKAAQAAPYVSSGRGADPRQFDTDNKLGSRFTPNDKLVNEADKLIASWNKSSSSGGGGGGGGGGKSEAEKLRDETKSRLEALQERFMTEAELQAEKYKSDQELLKSALEQKLLTEQEYHALTEEAKRKHEEKMAQLDVWRHGSSIAKTEAFLGEMADALATGNEKMLQISKAFGAAEALVNAWRTYSQVMADESLPWYAKIPTAISLFTSAANAISAIKGVGKGGSGQSSASGGSSDSASTSSSTSVGPTQTVSINLQGENFSKASVRGLLEQIQQELDNGGRLVIQ